MKSTHAMSNTLRQHMMETFTPEKLARMRLRISVPQKHRDVLLPDAPDGARRIDDLFAAKIAEYHSAQGNTEQGGKPPCKSPTSEGGLS